ncbi:alpha/beta hydrolase, partial [Maribacter sp.]|uniref:alpha/beta hydrolase n=1 Tax=Maribacter sp. TaxID=1897614 RepID=UPI0025C2876F
MKIYAISGLGADQRVFEHLNLDVELIALDWITPHKNESIKVYAKRLSEVIETDDEFCLIGVSFGGLIATEIGKILSPIKIVLISSVQTKYELRSIYKWVGNSKIIKLIPTALFNPPKIIAKYLMGAHNSKLFYEILYDTDVSFVKWALQEFTAWQNTITSTKVLKINGTKDKLIPP